LGGGVPDVGEKFTSFPSQMVASAQQIQGCPHRFRIGTSHCERAVAQQHYDLLRVDLVVLALLPWMASM
jgi:hypothetical protein